jgi:hypothetical protein
VALSPASARIHMAIVQPQPLTEFDDGRVEICAMLGAPSAVSCSSSSSSDSSGSESIMASPPPVPDMLISTVLQDISEVPEAKAADQAELVVAGPHSDTSAVLFLYIL